MNDLYNRIIANHTKNFPLNKDKFEAMTSILQNNFSGGNISYALEDFIRLEFKNSKHQKDVPQEVVRIKIQKDNRETISFLQTDVCKITNIRLSTLIRELFISFSELRIKDKEVILYSKKMESLEYAIKNKYELSITYKSVPMIIQPYLITTPIDDFSHFVIANTVPNVENQLELPILKLTELEIVHTHRYRPFFITHPIEEKIETLETMGATIYNKGEAAAIKKAFSHKGYGFAIPYILEDLRKKS